MKSVQCPLCNRQIFSETLQAEDSFPCPHCGRTIEIAPYTDIPTAKIPEDFNQKLLWAETIWQDGRLVLTSHQLTILGEFLVDSLEMDKWQDESDGRLSERIAQLKRAGRILSENGLKSDLPALGSLLLDICINMRKKTSSKES